MAYDPSIHHRRSIRLKGFDYTQPGAYFITIVAHRRENIFGEILDGEMRLNEWGKIARDEWLNTAALRGEIILDEFVIMPDHIHGIIMIMECDGDLVGARRRAFVRAQRRCAPTRPIVMPHSIGAIIRSYKSAVTTRINRWNGTPGEPVWQRNYWERIIRNDDELSRIREYIRCNPTRWMDRMDRSYL